MDTIEVVRKEDCPAPASAPVSVLGELGRPLDGSPTLHIYVGIAAYGFVLLPENNKLVEMLKRDQTDKVPLLISTMKNEAGNARFVLTCQGVSAIRPCGTDVVTYEAQACSGTGDKFHCVFCIEDLLKVFNQVIPDKIYLGAW